MFFVILDFLFFNLVTRPLLFMLAWTFRGLKATLTIVAAFFLISYFVCTLFIAYFLQLPEVVRLLIHAP